MRGWCPLGRPSTLLVLATTALSSFFIIFPAFAICSAGLFLSCSRFFVSFLFELGLQRLKVLADELPFVVDQLRETA